DPPHDRRGCDRRRASGRDHRHRRCDPDDDRGQDIDDCVYYALEDLPDAEVPRRVREVDRVVEDVAVAVEALRIARSLDEWIRGDEPAEYRIVVAGAGAVEGGLGVGA